jgi:hypothetical protein
MPQKHSSLRILRSKSISLIMVSIWAVLCFPIPPEVEYQRRRSFVFCCLKKIIMNSFNLAGT